MLILSINENYEINPREEELNKKLCHLDHFTPDYLRNYETLNNFTISLILWKLLYYGSVG